MNVLSLHRAIEKDQKRNYLGPDKEGCGTRTGRFGRSFCGTGSLGPTRQGLRYAGRLIAKVEDANERRRLARVKKGALLRIRQARDAVEAQSIREATRIPRHEQRIASALAFEIFGDMALAA